MDGVSMGIELNNNETHVYILANAYVERQRIVFKIFEDLQPYTLYYFNGDRNNINFMEEYLRIRDKYKHFSYIGVWGLNNEWEYKFHGNGCLIKHRSTDEPVEWEAPDANVFDIYWFLNWIKWLFRDIVSIQYKFSSNEDADVALESFVFAAIGKLTEKNMLSALGKNKYRIKI
jgi:hypothetical protein